MIRNFILLILSIFVLTACNQTQQKDSDENALVHTTGENIESYPARVLSFHTTSRCPTCLAIEKLVRETVLSEYSDQLGNERLALFVLNSDLPENQSAAETYAAYGSALFVSSGSGEGFIITDLTNEAFRFAVNNPERFQETLRDAINQHLQ